MHAAAGGSVDIQSVTEASLRIASCSGPVKLGKIKASSADVITEGRVSPVACMSMFSFTSSSLCDPWDPFCSDVSAGFPACLGYLQRTSVAVPRPPAAAAVAAAAAYHYTYHIPRGCVPTAINMALTVNSLL